jgi:toxin-antitoxin system PIN domain toxin
LILPDLNLLIYSYDSGSPAHSAARAWWEACLTEDRPVFLPWAVALGFLRLTTNLRLSSRPLQMAAACEIVASWLAQPHLSIIHPGERHAEILFRLLSRIQAGSNVTTDAHLAALAIEHRLELHTTDKGFAGFPGLRWRNPLKS